MYDFVDFMIKADIGERLVVLVCGDCLRAVAYKEPSDYDPITRCSCAWPFPGPEMVAVDVYESFDAKAAYLKYNGDTSA